VKLSIAAIAIALACGSVCARAETLSLEPQKPYVYAEDRIPGFKEASKPAEGYLRNPVPGSWTSLSLDGTWKLKQFRAGECLDYYELDKAYGPEDIAKLLAPSYDFSSWQSIQVPLPLCVQKTDGKIPDNYKQPGYIAYYQRSFQAPDFKDGSRAAFLKFHGAGFRTDVWIDGKYAGGHAGFYNPFELDVTGLVRPGQKHSLLVKTIHTRFRGDWHDTFVTGIFAPVELELRGRLFPKDIKIRPDLGASSVEVRFGVCDKDSVKDASFEALVEEAKSGKLAGSAKGKLSANGSNVASIPLSTPHCWSPEDPFLYKLRIKIDGKEEGVARFGFRSVEVKQGPDGREHFYLNGKRFYMRLFEYDYFWSFTKQMKLAPVPDDEWALNWHGQMRESMLAMKFANVNAFRPHSMEQTVDESFLNLCDELGFLVLLDWHGSESPIMSDNKGDGTGSGGGGGQNYRLQLLEKTLPSFVEMIGCYHNSPALSFISFGNEFFEHLLANGASYDPIIEKYKAALRAADIQGRPTCGSAGRPTYRHKAKVDFVDDHQYIGVYYGSYKDLIPYIDDATTTTAKTFGASIPFINSETGYVSDDRIHKDMYEIFNPMLSKDVFDKAKYLKTITGPSANEAWARLALNAGGVRAYYADLPLYKKRKATILVKRYIEIFRTRHEITDGVSLNTGAADLACKCDPDGKNPWPAPGKLTLIDPVYAFRQAFYPVQAFYDIDNLHILCGDSAKAPISLVNDSESNKRVDLVAQLRKADGSTLEILSKKGIEIPQGAKLEIPFELAIPADFPSGKTTLESFVISDGRKIAENAYEIYTLAKADRASSFPAKSLALYDNAAELFSGLGVKTTQQALDFLKIPYEKISSFESLSKYQVLIVGSNSMDGTLLRAGDKIAPWIEAGGRLLMFEQCACGPIPWSGSDRIFRMGGSSFVEHCYKKHPVFKGIEDEMAWESPWGHNASVYETCLDLNDSFLSVTAAAHFEDRACPKAVIADRKFGKGESLVSTVITADRFNKDSTITKYVENLMSYILSDSISSYAVSGDASPSATKALFLDQKDAFFVNISKAANRGFADDEAGDGKGGWTDFGRDADMRKIPHGTSKLSGMVPFNVIDPEWNAGKSCIVLAGPKRESFPKESESIPVGKRCDRIFFLHTAMYVQAAKGESVLDYEISYDDGRKETIPMRNQVEISDWWMAKDWEAAQVVYRDGDKCLLATEWVNPFPNQRVESVKAISKGNAIPVVVAITASVKAGSNVDRTSLDDQRK